MKRTACAAFAAAILLLLAGNYRPALSQVLYGSITGTIEDPSGAVVPGADITITNQGTTQQTAAKSDAQGRYSLLNLAPGTYNLRITASGFRTTEQTGITVSPNIVGRIDIRLEVGNMSEQVSVSAQTVQLQTDKADTHTEITTKAVTNMPLPAYRNYQSLINLVPGATPAAFQNSVTDTPNRSLATHINGTNDNNNVTRIDGASSVNLWLPHHVGYVMPAEMVDNVNVTTSAGDAQQGFAGGAAITVVTKSGTNEFHGSAFEFHDNQHLKARNFFQAPGVEKPLSIYNNYGGTFGGPILKNKLFFFVSYDGTRQRQGSGTTYTVPTADQRVGDFSAYANLDPKNPLKNIIFDPRTGDPQTGIGRTRFPDNKIPTSLISPQAAKVQSYYPLPNLPGPTNNYFAQEVPLFNRDYVDVKLNYNRGEKETFWGHYGKNWDTVSGHPIFGVAGGPAPGADPATSDTKIHIASIGHTYAFSPTFLMDNVFGYQRQDQSVLPTESYGTNYGEQLGIPGLNGSTIRESGFPNFDFSGGLTSLGFAGWIPAFRTEENFTMSHNFTWVKSAHEIRFGFDGVLYRMSHYQPELGAGPRGDLHFSGALTALNGGASPGQYNAYADFLLGMPNDMQKSLQYILMTPREWHFGSYLQDRWTVTPKLTLSLGVRYEYYPLMTRAHDKGIERLDPSTNLVYLGGRGDVPKNVGITTSKLLFAPRFGFAYRFDEKTVMRAGYGINYDPLPLSRPLRGFYPLTVNFDFPSPNGFTQATDGNTPLTLATGMPSVVGPDLSSGVVDLPAAASERSPYAGELHRGYTQSWNFTVERRLPSNLLFSMGYVGTQTVHQFADLDINAGYPGSGTKGLPYYAQFGRTQPTNMWDGYLSANYHSLQTSIRRQFSNGLMIQGAYTWSKAINMTDDDGWAAVNWNWAPVFNRNRAPAGYDRTHVFQIGWVYELPFGKGKPYASEGLLSHVIGNWEVDGVMAAYTGTPFNVTAPGNSLNAPNNMQTADLVKSDVDKLAQAGKGGWWFDPTAFKTITDQRFGSLGRNVMRGPGVFNTDLTLARTFPIKERVNLQFRSEWYNMPNSVHLNNPNGDSSSGDFMRILSSSNERQIRFGLRLSF